MHPTTYLEWFHDGAWHRIGWAASTPRATEDLREHGRLLAAHGGHYRLVVASVYRDAPPTVTHEYPTVGAA